MHHDFAGFITLPNKWVLENLKLRNLHAYPQYNLWSSSAQRPTRHHCWHWVLARGDHTLNPTFDSVSHKTTIKRFDWPIINNEFEVCQMG